MCPAWHSTNSTIQPTNTKMDESEKSSADQEKRSCSEPEQPTLFLYGASSLTARDRRELIALFSGTRGRSAPQTLSDRLTPSLILSGLVRGITPTSTRRQLGAPIPDFVLSLPDGRSVEQRGTDCES